MFICNLVLLLFPTPPIETVAPEPPTPVRESAACPQLFGTEAVREYNRKRRERRLLWAEEEPTGRIDVTHSTNWKRPRRTMMGGIKLLETDQDEAVIQVGPRHRELCPPGRYQIETDDALGRGNRVLAVVGDIVLLESRQRLVWLGEPEDVSQPWRMNWASWWKQPAPRMENPVTVINNNSGQSRRSTRAQRRSARRARARKARMQRIRARKARERRRRRR